MEEIVGGVEVEDDFSGVSRYRGYSCFDKVGFDSVRIGVNSVQAGLFLGSEFEAVESGFSRQCLALITCAALFSQRIFFAYCGGQQRIILEPLMIVDLLVASHQPVNALADEIGHASIKR